MRQAVVQNFTQAIVDCRERSINCIRVLTLIYRRIERVHFLTDSAMFFPFLHNLESTIGIPPIWMTKK